MKEEGMGGGVRGDGKGMGVDGVEGLEEGEQKG